MCLCSSSANMNVELFGCSLPTLDWADLTFKGVLEIVRHMVWFHLWLPFQKWDDFLFFKGDTNSCWLFPSGINSCQEKWKPAWRELEKGTSLFVTWHLQQNKVFFWSNMASTHSIMTMQSNSSFCQLYITLVVSLTVERVSTFWLAEWFPNVASFPWVIVREDLLLLCL